MPADYSGRFKDEDVNKNGRNWGKDGNAAKLYASKICSDKGYQDIDIKDRTNWVFEAECNTRVDPAWSRPFSDEAAREAGFSGRDAAAADDCIKKGYATATTNGFITKGHLNVQLPCFNPSLVGWNDEGCKGIAKKKYWSKVNVGTMDLAQGAAWYKDNKIPAVGADFGDGRKVLGKDSRSDSTGAYVGLELEESVCTPTIGNWTDEGCKGITKQRYWSKVDTKGADWTQAANWYNDNKIPAVGAAWTDNRKILGKDSRSDANGAYVGLELEEAKCNPTLGEWKDIGCKSLGQKEFVAGVTAVGSWEDSSKWLTDNKVGKVGTQLEGKNITKVNAVKQHDVRTGVGMNIYLEREDDACLPKWDEKVTGCDSAGQMMTVQKCNNWVNNDVNSCKDAYNKPTDIVGWIPCDIGSSPGGHARGDSANVCSPMSKSKDDFNCALGQNCFAINEVKLDVAKCPNISNGFGMFAFLGDLAQYGIYIVIFCCCICLLSSSAGGGLLLMVK